MKKVNYLIILVLAIVAGVGGFLVTKNSLTNVKSDSGPVPTQASVPTAQPTPNFEKTIGEFLVTDRPIDLSNGKPVVYFFGSSSCPHCVWEKPIAKKVFDAFKNEIVYHEDFDSQNDSDVFQKYLDINPGYIPFIILGGKYARVGAGENLSKLTDPQQRDAESKKLEEQALSAILCKLTAGKPASVCGPLKDITSQVK